jgi:predicted metal-dependent peptidase
MRMQDALIHLLLKQPFYGYIASSVTPVECNDIPTVSMSLLPVSKLLYNREWYEGLKEEHAIGVVIHELLHLILLHHFRKGNRERQLWVVACDMAVNEHIDGSLLTGEAITISKISEEIHETIPRLKSAEVYYDILSKLENSISLIENERKLR